MELSTRLDLPHLSFIARDADHELARVQGIIEHQVLVGGRVELEEQLGRMLGDARAQAPGRRVVPKTLDLIGHSTPSAALLTLGDWVIDARSPTVTAFFRELADHDVLPALGVTAVRLLGCMTAASPEGRATVRALADVLGLEVYGTTQLIYAAHYDRAGFRADCAHVLASASDLRDEQTDGAEVAALRPAPYPRLLDVDALPVAPLPQHTAPWPRRVASTETAAALLRLIQRDAGAAMPGLLAGPLCEVALPSPRRGLFHVAHVLRDGDFVRFYPDGPERPGIVFPTHDAQELRTAIAHLPLGER